MGNRRIKKQDLMQMVAKKSGLTISDAILFGNTLEEVLIEVLCDFLPADAQDDDTGGEERGLVSPVIFWSGLGRFIVKIHRGHNVQFGEQSIDDYPVAKFEISRSVAADIRKRYKKYLDDAGASGDTDSASGCSSE